MINKRTFLKNIVGGALAAKTVTPEDFAKVLSPTDLDGPSNTVFGGGAVVGGDGDDGDWRMFSRATDVIYGKINRVRGGGNISPPSKIAHKKSWSPAFKEICVQQDIREMEAVLNELENNKSFRDAMLKMLGQGN